MAVTDVQAVAAPASVSQAAEHAARVPIVIGITGHRDIADGDIPALEQRVGALLDVLRHRCPNTPLLILSPLAEGADRLVARVGLSHGAELAVPLPLPRDDYVLDFPGSIEEFDRFCTDARTVHAAPIPALSSPDVKAAQERRELQYALAGAYVARHSQILIAMWDGRDSDRIGGTSQIVRFHRLGRFAFSDALSVALAQAPPPFAVTNTPLDPHDTGVVYHIVTPRANRDSPDDPFSTRWLMPEGSKEAKPEHDGLPATLAADLDRLEAFNRDTAEAEQDAPGDVSLSAEQLYPDLEHALPRDLSALRRTFAAADALAVRFQRHTYRVLGALYILAFLAVLSFEMYSHLYSPADPRVTLFLFGYLAVLGIAYSVYLYSRRKQQQTKHQDYRALAEGLRVQFYWRVAGAAHSASDYYLRKQKDELAWIRQAVRACGVRAMAASTPDVQALGSRWIDTQRTYFGNAARREGERLARYRAVAGGVILASLAWAIPTVVRSLHEAGQQQRNWLQLLQIPLLVASVVLVWHLAFKGALAWHRTHSGGFREWFKEARILLLSAGLGVGFMLLMRRAPTLSARWPQLPADEHAWMVVALGIITVIGALVHSYTDKRAFSEHAHQYARMSELFTRAGERMAALLHDGKAQAARALGIELGKEALAEHGDWIMLHRERPIEPPKVEL